MNTMSTEAGIMEMDSTGGEFLGSEEVQDDVVFGEGFTAEGGDAVPVGEAGSKAEMTKFRLSGAARKRFRFLMEKGYEREEAGRLAQQPLTGELGDKFVANQRKLLEAEIETLRGPAKARYWELMNAGGYTKKEAFLLACKSMRDNAPKRIASEGGAGGPQNKFPKPTASPEGIKMTITCTDYPTTSLTDAQAKELKSAILKQVVQQKDAEVKPHFEYCAFAVGYLQVHCSDQKTCEWLKDIVTKLELWEGTSLKVVPEKELFKTDIYVGCFSDSEGETGAEILEYIQSQNNGLDTSKWNIISLKQIQPRNTVELMFTVDDANAKAIENLGYELNYKFVRVSIQKYAGPPSAINRNQNRYGGRNQNRYGDRNPNSYGDRNPNRYGGANWNTRDGNPFNLVGTLLDQLNIIGGGNFRPYHGGRGGNLNFNQYGGPHRRGGRGGYNPGGNRNFY